MECAREKERRERNRDRARSESEREGEIELSHYPMKLLQVNPGTRKTRKILQSITQKCVHSVQSRVDTITVISYENRARTTHGERLSQT